MQPVLLLYTVRWYIRALYTRVQGDLPFWPNIFPCPPLFYFIILNLQTVHSKQTNRTLKRKELLKRKKREE